MSDIQYTSHFHFTKPSSKKSFCVVNVSDGLSLGHAEAFSCVLKKYSGAQLHHISHAQGIDVYDDLIEDGAYATIGMYGMVFLRDEGLYTLRRIRIPAPLDSCFDDQRFKEEVGQEVAEAYSDHTGRSYRYDHGGLTGRTNNV